MKWKKFIFLTTVLVALTSIAVIYKVWFLSSVITGGDLPFLSDKFLPNIYFLSSWDIRNGGMGVNMLPTLWLEFYTTLTLKIFSYVGWNMYVKFVWLYPFLFSTVISSFFLSRKYFGHTLSAVLTTFLYTCNTYALLLVGGGQMGIALSYAVAPFSLIAMEYLLKQLTLKSVLIFSLAFALVLLLDLRIAYIMVVIFVVRVLFELKNLRKELLRTYFVLFAIGITVVVGLHMFWILPILLTHGSGLKQFGEIYTSTGAVKFFSFAKFENALGLLHPNWPENIFGKVGFMKPEFLLLPILAFSSLLFIEKSNKGGAKKENMYVIFLAFLALLGIFLAKGANDPFGGAYLWMFDHVPGFIMFRDPTKWYLLIVLSYSMLIPYTISKIYEMLKRRFS